MSRYGINAWEIVGVVTEDGDYVLCAACARKAGIDLSEDADERVIFASDEDGEMECDDCGEVIHDTY